MRDILAVSTAATPNPHHRAAPRPPGPDAAGPRPPRRDRADAAVPRAAGLMVRGRRRRADAAVPRAAVPDAALPRPLCRERRAESVVPWPRCWMLPCPGRGAGCRGAESALPDAAVPWPRCWMLPRPERGAEIRATGAVFRALGR